MAELCSNFEYSIAGHPPVEIVTIDEGTFSS